MGDAPPPPWWLVKLRSNTQLSKEEMHRVQAKYAQGQIDAERIGVLLCSEDDADMAEAVRCYLGMEGVAGPGPSSAVAGHLQRFKGLLDQAAISVDDRILTYASIYHPLSVMLAETPEQASRMYNLWRIIPHTQTRAQVEATCGTLVDGVIAGQGGTRSVILHAFEDGRPRAMKIPQMEGYARHEVGVWDKLKEGSTTPPHLAGPQRLVTFTRTSALELGRSNVMVSEAVLMPLYPCTLFHVPKLSEEDAIRFGGQLKEALEWMHSRGVIHCDVKAPNVFIDSVGDCFLGDFGATTEAGQAVRESTSTHEPANFDGFAQPFVDFFMLAVTLLEKMGQLQLGPGLTPHQVREAIGRVGNTKCKELLSSLVE